METYIIVGWLKNNKWEYDAATYHVDVTRTDKHGRRVLRRQIGVSLYAPNQKLAAGCYLLAVVDVDDPRTSHVRVETLYINMDVIDDNTLDRIISLAFEPVQS